VEGFLRSIRFPIRQSPDRSGITGETMQGLSGRQKGASTGHRMANPWEMLRNQYQAITNTRIRMIFPGIGHIDIRRLSHPLRGHMCRAALRRP
jgi:hypothetical protein